MWAIAGVNTLAVSFDEAVLGGDDPLRYELRRAGADGLLLNSDVPIQPLSVTWNGHAYMLKFDIPQGLLEDTYRLTTLDTITDLSGNALDGDDNGSYGGDYVSDFVVVDSDVQRVSTSSSGTRRQQLLSRYRHQWQWALHRLHEPGLEPRGTATTTINTTCSARTPGPARSCACPPTVAATKPTASRVVQPSVPTDAMWPFDSVATNLIAIDNNGAPDVFVKDLVTGELRLVSTDLLGCRWQCRLV